MIPHIISTKNVTVFIDGKSNQVPVGTAQYDLVVKAIEADDLQAVKDALNIRAAVVKASFGKITLEGTTLLYDGRPLHGALINRILTVFKDAGDAGPLLLFLENLMQNPSKRAVDELYGFLDACDLPITEDGHFLAYKKITTDWKDIYTKSVDNRIGDKPSVPRNSVDEDKDNTCSYGLHFCSKSYLPHFGSGFGSSRIVVVKINPRDVVAIPSDYNNAKGRCSEYEVVEEITITDAGDTGKEIKPGFENKYAAKPASPAPVAASPVGKGSLSDSQVREVRRLLAETNPAWTIVAIARIVGTSERTVSRIKNRETYTEVK